MKRIQSIIVIGIILAGLGTAPAEDPAGAGENSDIRNERKEIQMAATVFCTELRKERVEGLPSVEQMRRLSPLFTPELSYIIGRARSYQKEQALKYPDEKPDWIEGDLFSSSFEGVSTWELGEVFSAPMVDATVKVKQTYIEPGQEPVIWTDTLVFKERDTRWLLNDVRMGGKWAFKSGPSLRGILPGGEQALQDHDSLDGRWHITFTREGDAVARITIEPTDKSAPAKVLYGDGVESCPFPTWVVWSPECDMLAVRLGESPRFTRTLIFRHTAEGWERVEMPDFYPEEKQTMTANGFRERHRLVDAERWQDANTLVVQYFGNFTKADEGDGYHRYMSVHIDPDGKAKIAGAVEVPGAE